MKNTLEKLGLVLGLLSLCALAWAEDSAPVNDPNSAAETTEEPKSAPPEISTKMEGLDSLDVLPTEVVTSFDGGTRRINLENTVFRREEPIRYETAGHRDPFKALIRDEKKEGEVETDLLRVQEAVLTGVVWAEGQYLAMVRDKDGKMFFLRDGDEIYQGRVLSVTQSWIMMEVSEFGDYERITLKING